MTLGLKITLFLFQPFTSRGVDSLLPLETKIEREYDPLWPNDYEKVSVLSILSVLSVKISSFERQLNPFLVTYWFP